MPLDLDLIGDKLKSAIEINSRYSAALLDLSTSYLKSIGAILAATGKPGDARTRPQSEVVPPLLLAASVGESAQGSILVKNTLGYRVRAQVVPRGEGVASAVIVTPKAVQLEPGEQHTLQISVRIGADLRVNGDYPGELTIPELSSRTIPFVVRRLPDRAGEAAVISRRKRATQKTKERHSG
jgi:hypothetical protein